MSPPGAQRNRAGSSRVASLGVGGVFSPRSAKPLITLYKAPSRDDPRPGSSNRSSCWRSRLFNKTQLRSCTALTDLPSCSPDAAALPQLSRPARRAGAPRAEPGRRCSPPALTFAAGRANVGFPAGDVWQPGAADTAGGGGGHR